MPPLTTPPLDDSSLAGHRLWATSADGEGADTRPAELDALCSHLHHCTAARSPLAAVQGSVSRLRAFVLGHLVSSVAVLVALPALAWLLLAP